MSKICSKCKEGKEETEYIRSYRGKISLSCYCKKCFKVKKKENGRKSYYNNRIIYLKRQRDKRRRNIDKYKAREARYRERIQGAPELKARVIAISKRWRENNKEKLKRQKREWYCKNIKERKEYERKKRNVAGYKEKMKVYLRKYYKKNKASIRKKHKERRLLNYDKIITLERERARKERALLSNGYIKSILTHNSILKREDISVGLIELYRLNLTLKRLRKGNVNVREHQSNTGLESCVG